MRGLALAVGLTLAVRTLAAEPVPPAGEAPPLPALVEVSPEHPRVGDRVRVVVRVEGAPEGSVLESPAALEAGQALGPFHIVARSSAGTTLTLDLAPDETGALALPALDLVLRAPGGVERRVTAPGRSIDVASVLGEGDASDIADLKPPAEFPAPWPWRTIAAAAALLAAAGVLAWWIARRRRRGRRAPVLPEDALPPGITPDTWAREELARLLAQRHAEEGRMRELHIALADLARRYLELRFRVPAQERTTEEVAGELGRALVGEEIAGLARGCLERCDRVKFAKHVPGLDEAYETAHRLRALIDRSAPPPPGPAPSGALASAGERGLMFRFAHPWLLLAGLLALLPILGAIARERQGRLARVLYTELGALRSARPSLRVHLARVLPYGQALGIALAAVALARPQAGHRLERVTTEGIDIVVSLDVSGSMRAEDFAPKNRLNVARRTIASFVEGRSADRIGLVTFARYSETRCPPTLDYDTLETALKAVGFADERDDGTAIGSGIATAVNRLRTSKAKSRVVILLTDGINNAGSIDPLTAADLARAVGIRIHVIGVGGEGPVTLLLANGARVTAVLPIDEKSLSAIARATGGRFFRATDAKALDEIFRTIDGMEKTRVEVTSYGRYDELFGWLLAPGCLLLALDLAARSTLLVRAP